MLMKLACVLSVVLPLAAGRAADVPSTQPDTRTLTLMASEAFNRGDYAAALPVFKQLAERYRDQPGRLAGIEEQIRFCQRNLVVVAPPSTAPARDIDPSTNARRLPHAPPQPGEVRELTIKQLGNFVYPKEGGNVPEDVQKLNGLQIRTRGFMMPLDQADNVTVFLLAPSRTSCCLNQPPTMQHMILAHAPAGKAVDYCAEEIVVEGKLTVEEKREDGLVYGLFEVQCTSVKMAP